MSEFHVIREYTADEILNDNISNYPMLILSGGMYWSIDSHGANN